MFTITVKTKGREFRMSFAADPMAHPDYALRRAVETARHHAALGEEVTLQRSNGEPIDFTQPVALRRRFRDGTSSV